MRSIRKVPRRRTRPYTKIGHRKTSKRLRERKEVQRDFKLLEAHGEGKKRRKYLEYGIELRLGRERSSGVMKLSSRGGVGRKREKWGLLFLSQ